MIIFGRPITKRCWNHETDEAIHNIFQKNPCKNTLHLYNQGSTLAKTWDINGRRISNAHLWSVISMPIWYIISYMHMCITMIIIKIISLRIHTKVQATTLSFFIHTWRNSLFQQLNINYGRNVIWPNWSVDETSQKLSIPIKPSNHNKAEELLTTVN